MQSEFSYYMTGYLIYYNSVINLSYNLKLIDFDPS